MSMPYVSFRGVSTNTLNCYIAKMPSHRKAAMRVTEYTVQGRDGVLHVSEGYDCFDITVSLMLSGVTATNRQVINAWADGTGKLITSDDPTKCYIASVIEEIEWDRDFVNGAFWDVATITFKCQPFMYESVDRSITVEQDQTIVNLGNVVSRPLIEVDGEGDLSFTINGKEITMQDVQASHPVFIDAETGYVYTDVGSAKMTGEIPFFNLGNNYITIGDNVTKLVINPRWGWV